MNRDIIERLEQQRHRHDEEGDENRERAYRRAIESIVEYGAPIRSGLDAMELQGIGKGIASVIDSVLGTNTADGSPPPKKRGRQPKVPKEPREPKQTRVRKNSRTSPHEAEHSSSPPMERVKVSFSGPSNSGDSDFQPRGSQPTQQPTHSGHSPDRSHADKLLSVVKDIASGLGGHAVLADEYRRERQSLSRLIFLISERSLPKSINKSNEIIRHILGKLSNVLSGPVQNRDGSYDAVANFKSGYKVKCRFVAVPASEWSFSLMRYTGPDTFWQRLQQHAHSKGMRLTDRSLVNGGVMEICRTENEIFQRLGIAAIPPSRRF